MTTIEKKKVSLTLPTSVAQARKWVNQLPTGNFGEMTRLIYLCTRELNKNQLSSTTRIAITEIIQPFAEMAINNLKKHLIARSFPLPERSRKIFELNQALLLEMAGSYQLSALDMLTKGIVNKKQLLLSVGRSLNYMGRVLLDTYNIYTTPKEALWRDIHHLYLLACENKIEKLIIPNKSQLSHSCKTIEDYYKHTSLLALSRPNTIRIGEITRLDSFFRQILDDVSLFNDTTLATGKYAHIAMLNSDEPATLMPVAELLHSPTVRLFNLTSVIKKLTQFVKETKNSKSLGTNETFPMLTNSLARRLMSTMSIIKNRQFKRFPRGEQTPIVSHLNNIVKIIQLEQEQQQDQNDILLNEDSLFEEMIYGESSSTSSPWAAPDVATQLNESDLEMRVWHIENSSSEGYGLLWEHHDPSGVRVGELIALQDPADAAELWQIGTVRWMESRPDKGLRAGVSLLSPRAFPITIKNVINRKLPQKFPFEGLFLPRIEGLKESAYLVLPDYMFAVKDKLTITRNNQTELIELISINERQGAFALCEYITTKIDTEKKKKNDGFNEIWDSL
jgi:hypothetical protein